MKKVIITAVINLLFFLAFYPASVKAAEMYDLANPLNFNLRIDGQAWHDHIPDNALKVADLDNDGINDYIVGSIGSDYNGSHSGSIFIINGTLLKTQDEIIGRTWDLKDPDKYSLRIDGSITNGYYPNSLEIADLNNDGKTDIFVGEPFGKPLSAAYVIFNDLLTNYTGTGNSRSLSDPSSYSIKYTGSYIASVTTADFDADSLLDVAIGAYGSSNTASYSGSTFILFNQKINDAPKGSTIPLTDNNQYDLRLDGAGIYDYLGNKVSGLGDINGDGKEELGVASYGYGNGNGQSSSSIYIFSGAWLSRHKNSGSNFSVSDPSIYNIRIDGNNQYVYFGTSFFASGDIDGDGKQDLIAAASGENSWTGAVYLLCGNSLSDKLNTYGNILETSQGSNYNAKFLGINPDDAFGYYGVNAADFNNDNKDDLILGLPDSDENGINSGSLYVIYSSLNNYCSNTGSSFLISDPLNYSVKYLGVAGSGLANIPPVNVQDINRDGKNDILVGALYAGFNNRSESGSAYMIYNFPHNLSLDASSSIQKSASFTLTGSVNALNSISNIGGVQYSVNNNTFSGIWEDCTSTDSAFDSKSENYSCLINNLSDGAHTVYLRAYDKNFSFTAKQNYLSKNVLIDTTSPTGLSLAVPSGYSKDNTKPILIFKKAIDNGSGIASYSVILDSDKNQNWSTTEIPNIGDPNKPVFVWKDDSNVNIEFAFENDSDPTNDEIRIYFKGLDASELTEGVHFWKVIAYDKAGNILEKSQEFYLDKNSPVISDLTFAGFSNISGGEEYKFKLNQKTLSFSGKAVDLYQGSTKINADSTTDTFNKTASGPDKINLTLKKLNFSNSSANKNADYQDYLTKEYLLSDIKDIIGDKKEAFFNLSVSDPLVSGYYQVIITLKDQAGNLYLYPAFFLKANN